MCGSTEAHALASKPIRYVLGDERDRWAVSAGTEGDPWELAMARQTTFYNAKAVEVSTPTIKGHSAIAKSYVKGTMERWVSQCPHCKGFHELRWEDIRYEYDTIETHGEKTYKVKDVWYLCPECGCISDEVTMKRAPAHWQAENPAAYENGIRSFWLNSFVSQWAAWKDTVLKYLNALGDTKKMQVVYNTRLGLLWEDRGDVQDEDTMLGRREEYTAELPEGVLVLTAGVDTQDDRMEYEIVGFGHFGETWGIEKGIVSGRPDSDEVWQQLDELVFDRKLKFADGVELPVSIKFVDEGGGFIGVGEPTACQHQGRYFQLSDVMGVDREMGFSLSTDKYNTCDPHHFILEDIDTAVDFGEGTSRIYAQGKHYQILAQDGEYSQLVVNEYGKGHSVYFAGLPYSPQNCRILLRAIYYAAGMPEEMKHYYVTNVDTEVTVFPETKRIAVINNADAEEKTDLYIKGHLIDSLTLAPREMRWVDDAE